MNVYEKGFKRKKFLDSKREIIFDPEKTESELNDQEPEQEPEKNEYELHEKSPEKTANKVNEQSPDKNENEGNGEIPVQASKASGYFTPTDRYQRPVHASKNPQGLILY